MATPTLARRRGVRLLKTALFLLIGMAVGRILGNPEIYINHAIASKISDLVYGDINAETMYDTYFYLDVLTVVITTTVIYFITMKLIRKIRSK
jgi:hypothetical protein